MQAAVHTPKDFVEITSDIHKIDAKKAVSQLEDKEANYAYYMAQASWQGSKICWFQRSYESPALFVLLKLMFSEGCESLKAKVSAAGLTDDQWKQMTAYSACVFNNCGNFRSFGDTKFVPEFDQETFSKFVKASGAYSTHKE